MARRARGNALKRGIYVRVKEGVLLVKWGERGFYLHPIFFFFTFLCKVRWAVIKKRRETSLSVLRAYEGVYVCVCASPSDKRNRMCVLHLGIYYPFLSRVISVKSS